MSIQSRFFTIGIANIKILVLVFMSEIEFDQIKFSVSYMLQNDNILVPE